MVSKKAFYSYVLILTTFLLLLSGCVSSSGTSNSSGIKAGVGVNLANKTITLGILTPLSGPVADPIGKPLTRGIEVFFKSVNDHGGIDGFKVNLVEKDSQYSPQLQVQQYGLIHNQVLMIAESLGTPTSFAIKDQAARTGYNEAVTAYQLHDVGKGSYAVTDTDFTAQVSQLKAAGAKYVFLTSTPVYTAKIIGTAHALGYDPQWILQSPAFSPLLLAVPSLVPLLSKAWIVSQGATWGDTSKPGMKALLDDVAKYAPDQKPDGFFEFGYTESKITYTILKKAIENNDLTRDGLLTAFDSLKNVDLGGLLPPVTYGTAPNDRVPTRDNIVYIIDPTQPTSVKALSDDFTGSAAMQSQF